MERAFKEFTGQKLMLNGLTPPSIVNLKAFIAGQVGECAFAWIDASGQKKRGYIKHHSLRSKAPYFLKEEVIEGADLIVSCYPAFLEDSRVKGKSPFPDHKLRLGVGLAGEDDDILTIYTLNHGWIPEEVVS